MTDPTKGEMGKKEYTSCDSVCGREVEAWSHIYSTESGGNDRNRNIDAVSLPPFLPVSKSFVWPRAHTHTFVDSPLPLPSPVDFSLEYYHC